VCAQGKLVKPSRPPTVGLGAYASVSVALAYAACVYTTGDLNPQARFSLTRLFFVACASLLHAA
jgi:mevalonate kinase